MPVYQGVVKDNAVVLPEGVQLDDGLVVEVVVPTNELAADDLAAREAAFRQHLIDTGRLIQPPAGANRQAVTLIEPVEVEGVPLSEMIIADRR